MQIALPTSRSLKTKQAIKQKLTHQDFEILDSIRGIASFYVMVAHCRGVLWIGGSKFLQENPIESWSWTDYLIFSSSLSTRLAVEFVIVFFVLSGFSIAYSLDKNNKTYSFYKKRFIRIYPPYFSALLWAGVVFIISREIHPEFYSGFYHTLTFNRYLQMNDFFHLSTIIKNLVYLPSEGFIVPFWSLTHEVIFYTLAPLLMTNRRWYYRISLLLFISYLVFVEILGLVPGKSLMIEFSGLYNFYFCVGIFLFNNYSTLSGYLIKIEKTKSAVLILVSLISIYAVNFIIQTESPWSFIPAGILSCLLITFFLTYQIKIPILIKLGRHSYSLYITHFATIYLFHACYYLVVSKSQLPLINNYFVFMLAIPFCILISYLFYLLVEKRTKSILSQIRSTPLREANE